MNTKNIRLQSKIDESTNWKDNNPILLENEIGYESDTGNYKMGTQDTHWEDLEYANNIEKGESVNTAQSLFSLAISHSSTSLGYDNYAGSKAFLITAFDMAKNTMILDSVEGLETGDLCSCQLKNNYNLCGTISSIDVDTNTVYFDSLNLDEKATLIEGSAVLWVPKKPLIGTTTIGTGAFSEGYSNLANQVASHAEGYNNMATGKYSHAEGRENIACYSAHAEGQKTEANGDTSHSEGYSTIANGRTSHTEGYGTQANSMASHAENYNTIANGDYSHAEGSNTITNGIGSHAENYNTTATGDYSHAEGHSTTASGYTSHTEGHTTTASGQYGHAEGWKTEATEICTHAEGATSKANGKYSHAEGQSSQANGNHAHAEGLATIAAGSRSHTEGWGTEANGQYSHAEGYFSKATKNGAHAGGENAIARGAYSFAHGLSVQTSEIQGSTVFGAYNDSTTNSLFSVGNGISENSRSNAMYITPSGQMNVQGGIKSLSNYVCPFDSTQTPRALPVLSYVGTFTSERVQIPEGYDNEGHNFDIIINDCALSILSDDHICILTIKEQYIEETLDIGIIGLPSGLLYIKNVDKWDTFLNSYNYSLSNCPVFDIIVYYKGENA